ncbi:MAG: hypothetical protein V3R86_08100 [Candidatus Hydrothermarchaeaceae archaeon]
MNHSNADLWLLVLKEDELKFEDIKKTINQISESGKFDYDTGKGKHAIFHMILSDLDMLCQSGYAIRTFEKENKTEIVEKFRITPKGMARAERLLSISRGHRK